MSIGTALPLKRRTKKRNNKINLFYIPSVYQVCSQVCDMQPSKDGGVFGLYHKGRIARYLSPLTTKVVTAEGHHRGYYKYEIRLNFLTYINVKLLST